MLVICIKICMISFILLCACGIISNSLSMRDYPKLVSLIDKSMLPLGTTVLLALVLIVLFLPLPN